MNVLSYVPKTMMFKKAMILYHQGYLMMSMCFSALTTLYLRNLMILHIPYILLNSWTLWSPQASHHITLLTLKKGMLIILLQNLSSTVSNGTCWLIVRQISRSILECSVPITAEFLDIPRIALLSPADELPFIFKRRKFPVWPSYAMTINKSQGQTLQEVGIFLPQGIFAHGQRYVALSRVCNPHDLFIFTGGNPLQNIVYKEVLIPRLCPQHHQQN